MTKLGVVVECPNTTKFTPKRLEVEVEDIRTKEKYILRFSPKEFLCIRNIVDTVDPFFVVGRLTHVMIDGVKGVLLHCIVESTNKSRILFLTYQQLTQYTKK